MGKILQESFHICYVISLFLLVLCIANPYPISPSICIAMDLGFCHLVPLCSLLTVPLYSAKLPQIFFTTTNPLPVPELIQQISEKIFN